MAMELPLRQPVRGPTVAEMRGVVAALAGTGERSAGRPWSAAGRDGEIPLSYAQQRLWFLEQMEPGAAAYNVPVALRLRGALEVAALEAAWRRSCGGTRRCGRDFAEAEGQPCTAGDRKRPCGVRRWRSWT